MNLKANLFVLIVFVVMTLAAGELINRIVGGHTISIKSVPWQVSIQTWERGSRSKHFCGGSIISEKYIVTAGHCVHGRIPSNFRILVGTTFSNRFGEKFNVSRIILHQKYNSTTQDYDIALIQLAVPLHFSDLIQSIALPNANETIPDGEMCTVSGWGDKRRFLFFQRTALRAVEVPIVNRNKCFRAYIEIGGITKQMVCAGYDQGGRDACQGDSGGPLACGSVQRNGAPVLYGIVSWGLDCAEPNYPGVYTRVQTFTDWIYENTGLNKSRQFK